MRTARPVYLPKAFRTFSPVSCINKGDGLVYPPQSWLWLVRLSYAKHSMPISSSQSIQQCPSKLIKRQYMLRNGLVIIRNYLHVAMKRKSSSRSGLVWPHEYRSYRRVNPVFLFLIRYNSPFVVGGIYGCVSHLSRTILNCGRTGPEHRRRSFGCLIMVGEPVWYDLSRHCPHHHHASRLCITRRMWK